jgi:mRNA interferase MazF
MQRGEIWWAELPRPAGRRPVILLSRDQAYSIRELVIVAPITTRIRGIPTEVGLGRDEGLPKRCVANLDSPTTVPKRVLSERISRLRPSKLAQIDDALRFALGLA